MFVHIVPKSQLRHPRGVLTYRSPKGLSRGQLVVVTLRGRKIPGITLKSKESAGTSAYILPVKKVGKLIVSDKYLTLIDLVAKYYTVNQARAFYYLAPYINTTYVSDSVNTVKISGPQKLVVTPSNKTALYKTLVKQYQAIPIGAKAKRDFWWQIANGFKLNSIGSISAASLPFSNLIEVLIDSPFASPYNSERSPFINAAQIACFQTDNHRAKLYIRSVLPLSIIKQHLSCTSEINLISPDIKRITVMPSTSGYNLNDDMIADIKDKVERYKKVLIYENTLSHQNEKGALYGLEQTASLIAKKTGIKTGFFHQNQTLSNTPITVATSAVLYSSPSNYKYAYILNLDNLVSPIRVKSAPETIEAISILASRTPLTVQTKEQSGWISELCSRQLVFNESILSQIPKMQQRIIKFTHKDLTKNKDISDQIKKLWSEFIIGTENNGQTITCLGKEQLTADQSLLILSLPTTWTVETRANTLPKTS